MREDAKVNMLTNGNFTADSIHLLLQRRGDQIEESLGKRAFQLG